MAQLGNVLSIAQLVLSLLLIGGILLQQRGAGLGGAFGGGDSDSAYSTRRGAEKTLFQATMVIAVLFALTSLASLFI